jgi:uncharacterized protein
VKQLGVDPRFKKGLHLFNEKEFFECHEVIEELWLETPDSNEFRDLYKGVIQAAAAIYQFDRGILSGAIGLYKTCLGYLERYKPESLGLNVERLIDEMKICFAPLEKWDRTSEYVLDQSRVPVLEYTFLDEVK